MWPFYLLAGAIMLGIVLVIFKRSRIVGKVLLNLTLSIVILGVTGYAWLSMAFANTSSFYMIILFAYAIIAACSLFCIIWGGIRKKHVYISLLTALAVTTFAWGGYAAYEHYDNSIPTIGDGDVSFQTYAPYGAGSKVAVLDEEPTLKLTENLPHLDGATALFPVYSAFARAVYPQEVLQTTNGLNQYLACSKTANAYTRLINGEVDMIFVASASDQQAAYAKEKGVELTFTPIGKEAFVFFVNAQNPINGLTVEQIKQIYSGEITNWDSFGVNLGKIRAFQREEGSGSQTALQKLMDGKTLITPPQEDVSNGMGGIIRLTADYKNYKNSIGYSFRFYCTEMVKNNQIKLLELNGIAPSKETIADGTYPIASEFFAVTTPHSNASCQALLEWICSKQGQQLVDKTGYVPVY